MRKWVVIGVAVLAVIGGGYVVSQPKKGTVEWHKKEYFRERDGSRIAKVVRSVLEKIGRPAVDSSQEIAKRLKRADQHYTALMRLGYLRERVFVVSNCPAEDVADALWFTIPQTVTNEVWPLGQVSEVGTNTITVVLADEEMAQWEQAIRLADSPKQ